MAQLDIRAESREAVFTAPYFLTGFSISAVGEPSFDTLFPL